MKYRQILYTNYHTTQSGRASGVDAKSLFQREKRQFQREILPLLTLKKDAGIFDLGCGSGSLLKMLQENGFTNAMGMDISEEQVNVAHAFGVANVELGDALNYIKSQQQKFDLITGMDIIEHFTKDELVELLQAVRHALKPGGKALFRTPNLDAAMSTVFANGDFTHENYMNASSARQVCMACGFSEVKAHSSVLFIENAAKEFLRKCVWSILKFRMKLILFATARSSRDVLFTPNMIIEARVTQ